MKTFLRLPGGMILETDRPDRWPEGTRLASTVALSELAVKATADLRKLPAWLYAVRVTESRSRVYAFTGGPKLDNVTATVARATGRRCDGADWLECRACKVEDLLNAFGFGFSVETL